LKGYINYFYRYRTRACLNEAFDKNLSVIEQKLKLDEAIRENVLDAKPHYITNDEQLDNPSLRVKYFIEAGIIDIFAMIRTIRNKRSRHDWNAYIENNPIFPANLFKKMIMFDPMYKKRGVDEFIGAMKYGARFDKSSLFLVLRCLSYSDKYALPKLLKETQFYVDGEYHIPKDTITKYISIYKDTPAPCYMEWLLENGCEFNEEALVYSLLTVRAADIFRFVKKNTILCK